MQGAGRIVRCPGWEETFQPSLINHVQYISDTEAHQILQKINIHKGNGVGIKLLEIHRNVFKKTKCDIETDNRRKITYYTNVYTQTHTQSTAGSFYY